jgi:hypothetical protein
VKRPIIIDVGNTTSQRLDLVLNILAMDIDAQPRILIPVANELPKAHPHFNVRIAHNVAVVGRGAVPL